MEVAQLVRAFSYHDNNGAGYTSAPTVTFTGSNQTKAPNALAEITFLEVQQPDGSHAAGTGAVIINGSNNSAQRPRLGSGGPSETTVAVIDAMEMPCSMALSLWRRDGLSILC